MVFILGAAVGSFLNVVIYRLPAGLSLIYPPSRCPRCHTRLKPYDNVPVLGWLWLRGRCRYCRAPIAGRYPLIEFITGLLFVSVLGQFGGGIEMLGYWLLVSWLLVLALIDLDTLTLPDPLTISGLCLGWGFHAALAYTQTQTLSGGLAGLMTAVVASIIGLWLFDSISVLGSILLGKTAMGGGDAKLAAMLGAWLGWQGLLLSTFLAAAIGAFGGVGAIALGQLDRQRRIPFGPMLVLGALITLFYGNLLIQAYLGLFLPPVS
ncbi:prepilin peptidase [Vasconcelosia minhoensis]|uniref:prepilin peptidase n=1 Tax=Vasconcelosia minhoensis TaxID=3366354 RepID=UPI001D147B81|nr:A24 family peptidase [Romeria gracilis]